MTTATTVSHNVAKKYVTNKHDKQSNKWTEIQNNTLPAVDND